MSGEILAAFKPNIKNLERLTDEGELKLILIFRRARRRTAMDVNFMRNQRMKKKVVCQSYNFTFICALIYTFY